VCAWRFYDHFRVDADAPARQPVIATRTPVLAADGRDLVAALSDGTLRYLLWAAAFMTPRPPPLMVLNEPVWILHHYLLPRSA
jgi:predicted ATPase